MTNEWELRLPGPMPRGKFEFQCICRTQTLNEEIPEGVESETFTCPQCGATITVRDQQSHYHISIKEI